MYLNFSNFWGRTLAGGSARFWLKKLLAQVHATQNIYLHNSVGICTKEGLNTENTTQIAKYKIWFLERLLKWASSCSSWNLWLKNCMHSVHCRLENLLAQRKKCMHLCKCACVKSPTGWGGQALVQKWGQVSNGGGGLAKFSPDGGPPVPPRKKTLMFSVSETPEDTIV